MLLENTSIKIVAMSKPLAFFLWIYSNFCLSQRLTDSSSCVAVGHFLCQKNKCTVFNLIYDLIPCNMQLNGRSYSNYIMAHGLSCLALGAGFLWDCWRCITRRTVVLLSYRQFWVVNIVRSELWLLLNIMWLFYACKYRCWDMCQEEL